QRMSTWQLTISHAFKLLIVIGLVGLALRGRYRVCWSFPVYLVVNLIATSLVSFWPERFYTLRSWTVLQALCDVSKVAVALEITSRVFRAFPGARALARIATMAILAVTTMALVVLHPPVAAGAGRDAHTWLVVIGSWQPRIPSGTIWLMTSTALLVL